MDDGEAVLLSFGFQVALEFLPGGTGIIFGQDIFGIRKVIFGFVLELKTGSSRMVDPFSKRRSFFLST